MEKRHVEVPELSELTSKDLSHSIDLLKRLTFNSITCNNWEDQFPYTPKASFVIAHNGAELFIHFHVEESCTVARVNVDHGRVYEDSCVEFFFAPDEHGYYNFEFNCIGKMLLAYRKERKDSEPAALELMQQIIRFSSLGSSTFSERKEDTSWDLTVVIPISLLFKHSYTSWKGVRGTANFYKCGDKLSQPHYLSWNPIENEKPNFHLEHYFGSIDIK